MTTTWSADPPDARTARLTCRGCARALWPVDGAEGQWEDADGRVICFEGGQQFGRHGRQSHQVLRRPTGIGWCRT